tara:strand:- start:383 stop:766 length:384 start_codon:yes stop_codon:yes gene_type:complete
MAVIIKYYGFLALAIIFYFPIIYVVHIIQCYVRNDRFIWRGPLHFCWAAHHSKTSWAVFVLWALPYANAEVDSPAFIICSAIYAICFIISLTPIHKKFAIKNNRFTNEGYQKQFKKIREWEKNNPKK